MKVRKKRKADKHEDRSSRRTQHGDRRSKLTGWLKIEALITLRQCGRNEAPNLAYKLSLLGNDCSSHL